MHHVDEEVTLSLVSGEVVDACHGPPTVLGELLGATGTKPGKGLFAIGLRAPRRKSKVCPGIPYSVLDTYLIAADGVDRLLEPGEIDQSEMVDRLADEVFDGEGERRWPL